MQAKLVIVMNANDLAHPGWMVTDTNQCVQHGDPQQLEALQQDREVIVVVPPEDILLTSVTLPKMNRSRLLQAIPFALEEQIIPDVETLHFAAGQYFPDTALPVAIVAHEKMQAWMALLHAWHVRPDIMLPVTLTLPYEEKSWQVLLDNLAVVRTGKATGFACDRENIATLLNAAITGEQEHVPHVIQIRNYTNHAFANILRVTAKVEEAFFPQEQMVMDIANGTNTEMPLNLLQGNYAVKKNRLPQMGKMLKACTYLAIAWVCLLFISPIISYAILKTRVNNINNQISAIYQRNFPQSSSIVEPKVRMQEKLQKLTGQVGESHLLMMLGYIGKGMLETPSIKLKRLEFQNNQTSLELTASTSEDFSAFTDYLTRNGFNVKQQTANLAGARINATIQIE